MKRVALIVSLALVAVLALAAVGALAATSPKGSWPEKRQEQKDQRAKRITERIELVIARFNNNKDRHIAAYNAAKAKIQQLITRLAAQGYDVSKLTADLQTWDGMVAKSARDYASFINLLTAAEQYVPYESEGQFRAALEQARAQLKIARQDVLDIRHYYQTVIRPDIQAVKGQKPASSSPGSSTP